MPPQITHKRLLSLFPLSIPFRIMMTESYSSPEIIKKFYTDGAKDGSHLPFNFQLITKIDNSSKAADIVKVITDWLQTLPAGKVTNWVVSTRTDKRQ